MVLEVLMGDENSKNNIVNVRLSDEDLERLGRLSEWAKMSRSETIRTLILEAKNYYISDDKK